MKNLHVAGKWRWTAAVAAPVGAALVLSSTALALTCSPRAVINCEDGNHAKVGVFVAGHDLDQFKEGKLVIGHGSKIFGTKWALPHGKDSQKSERIALVDLNDATDIDGIWNFALLTDAGKLLDVHNHHEGVFKVEIKGCRDHHKSTPAPAPTPTPEPTPITPPAHQNPSGPALPQTGLAEV